MVRYYALGLLFLLISCIPHYFDEYGYPYQNIQDIL